MYSLCAAVEEDNRNVLWGTTDKNSFYKVSHRKTL